MYSQSQSFLGGGNSARPGTQQYGQSQFLQQQQQQQQQQAPAGFPQQGSFGPQATGYPQQSLQPQVTGYMMQPQPTGFPNQSQPTGYSFQQQPSQQLQSPQSLTPAKTGQTSSQIAASFAGSDRAEPRTATSSSTVKIPKIRLSFLTAQDQAKFEQLFKSAIGNDQALSGDKVRDLLLRSKLPGTDLSNIWILSDTTKSGQLLFPEFALAMYLCNLRIVGKELPNTLPDHIKNEVSSMVDIISFGIPDDAPPPPARSNMPNFDLSSPGPAPTIQQPQPQLSNQQLLAQITAQPTGFASRYIPPQPTGFQQPAQTGFSGPSQMYQGPRPPMPPMPTNFGQPAPSMPLNAQPTGVPGQWGLVNAPATGLPNIEALQARMMPQQGREGGFTTAGLAGNATVPWAITKEEKRLYDQVFKAWDGLGRGYIGGDTAIEVMGQSGLPKNDLEKVWTLCDPNNRGKLDLDEFAVAMHLIYRKLNGYPIPNRLPPELVPPSIRNLDASIGHVKSLLSQESEIRKSSGAFLQPQQTGVSYLKSHSLRGDTNGISGSRKDATVFRNNDEDIGYRSSARRRVGGGRSGSPAMSDTPSSDLGELTLDQLRRKVKEKRVLLDAMDFTDENDAEEDDALDRKDRYEADELYRRIRRVQEDLDSHPSSMLGSTDSGAERRSLKRQLQNLTDKLPELASNVRKTERNIADAKLELFRTRDAKANPNSAATIVGTGPGGMVTESDRLKARAKAMMQQRSAALSGKAPPAGGDFESATKRLEEESQRVKNEREINERMIKDVEDSVTAFSRSLADNLQEGGDSASSEHERRRWEDALGVEDEVRDFIFDLQRSSRAARVRKDDQPRDKPISRQDSSRDATLSKTESSGGARTSGAVGNRTSTPVQSTYKTTEDRATFIKQQAEQRMAERLAALGLKAPASKTSSPSPIQPQVDSAANEKRKLAEEEDAKRESERQRRLAEEGITPPAPIKAATSKSKPPPPPTRGSRNSLQMQQNEAKRKADQEAARLKEEQDGREKMLRAEQEAQEAKTKELEDETRRQEESLAKEKVAAEARLKDLQRQYEQGRLKKQEEKKRKQATESAAKEKEARLAAQRAELEAARERERKLQQQLEDLANEDSSDEESGQLTPKDHASAISPTPSSQESSTIFTPASEVAKVAESPERPPMQPQSSYSSETKNPFFKKLSQSGELPAVAPPTITSSTNSSTEHSNNPFRGLTQQQPAATPLSAQATGGLSRRRPEEDEWSAVGSSNDDSSSDDDDPPVGGSAKHLASKLFGMMGPPRPLSASDDKRSPATPTGRFSSPPPPSAPDTPIAPLAPPLPSIHAPPIPKDLDTNSADFAPPGPPPPPPTPPPSVAAGGPPAASRPGIGSALLGDIQRGKGLKKVETKDRSQATVTGRVLD